MGSASLLPASLVGRLRPLSGRDEELLASERGGNAAALCNELLARCLVPAGREPGAAARDEIAALLVHDRDLALVELRRRTFGEQLPLELACTACAARHEVTIDLDRLVRPADAARQLVLDRLGHHIHVRLPTAGDQVVVAGAANGDVVERRAMLLARTLLALDARTGPFAAADVLALSADVRAAIEDAIEAALPDIDLALMTTCPSCGAAIEAPVQLAQIVLAELRERSRHLLREVHLLARAYHWSERQILALATTRRRAYLALIDAEHDAALFAEATS